MKQVIRERLEMVEEKLRDARSREALIRFLMDRGQCLPKPVDGLCTAEYEVHGCAVKVWIKAEIFDESVTYHAFSESRMINGILSLFLEIYDHAPAEEILTFGSDFSRTPLWQQFLPQSKRLGISSVADQFVDLASGEYPDT